MAQPTQPTSPLRQRMIEDMKMRKLAPKTQASYICAVKKLSDYLGHSPHTATAEDLRRFQLHLTNTGTSRPLVNRFRTSVFSKRDTEKCIAGGRDRHTGDAQVITSGFQNRPIRDSQLLKL